MTDLQQSIERLDTYLQHARYGEVGQAWETIKRAMAEPPLPRCWCGAEAMTDEPDSDDGAWRTACQEDHWHGQSFGAGPDEARENWRKLRGAS